MLQRFLLKHFRNFFYTWFSGRQWVRRGLGGHWEEWFFEPVMCMTWYQFEKCSMITGHRPGGCHGTPNCEDWTRTAER